MKKPLLALMFLAMPILAQTASPAAPASSNTSSGATWQSIAFLEGTWTATTQGNSVATSGRYTFASELGHHIMARHSTTDPDCKGPATFDCEHGDLLYIFQEAPSQPLKAIYFDNEGHVIHYAVTTPDAATVIFLSEPGPGPRFRLVYQLKEKVMLGKFQMQMPGQDDWKSYLEWSGGKA
jgi:hypothetical protein